MKSFEKYKDFFPKKVDRCPCVLSAVKHCFENGEHSLGEILESVKSFDYGFQKENLNVRLETAKIRL